MRGMKKAMTLVEVLIAIFVFGIGILTILNVITKNMVTLDIVRIQNQASVLAKESLEMLINVRDTNILRAQPWNCVAMSELDSQNSSECVSRFLTGDVVSKSFHIQQDPAGVYTMQEFEPATTFQEQFASSQLRYHTGGTTGQLPLWYDTTTGGAKTVFARYLVITGVRLAPEQARGPVDKIVKAESHVLYQFQGRTGDVVVETFLTQHRE